MWFSSGPQACPCYPRAGVCETNSARRSPCPGRPVVTPLCALPTVSLLRMLPDECPSMASGLPMLSPWLVSFLVTVRTWVVVQRVTRSQSPRLSVVSQMKFCQTLGLHTDLCRLGLRFCLYTHSPASFPYSEIVLSAQRLSAAPSALARGCLPLLQFL